MDDFSCVKAQTAELPLSACGTPIKGLIHEEFGDGIMSAIDFSMDMVRQPDPKGDRVNVVLSGKFLARATGKIRGLSNFTLDEGIESPLSGRNC